MGYLKNDLNAFGDDDRLRQALESYTTTGPVDQAALPADEADAPQAAPETEPADPGDSATQTTSNADLAADLDNLLTVESLGLGAAADKTATDDITADLGLDVGVADLSADAVEVPAAPADAAGEDSEPAAETAGTDSAPATAAPAVPAAAVAAEGLFAAPATEPAADSAADAGPAVDPRPDVVMPEPGPSDPAPAAAGDAVSAPAPATSLYTIGRYLNEYNTPAGTNDFWDEFWGGGADTPTPHVNLTNSGFEAQNGTLYYNVVGNWYDPDGLSDDPNATTRINAIRHALNVYEDILHINFIETTVADAGTVDLAFGNEVSGKAFANFSMGGGGEIYNAYINIAKNWSGTGNIGDYYFHTALHEIGHTLGLGHSGNYNAGAGNPTYNDAYWQNDTIQFTMMSYWAQANYTPAGELTPSGSYLGQVNIIGPQSVDWLALDRIYDPMGYGINDGVTASDTTWGFNSTWYDWTPGTTGPAYGYANTAFASLDTLLDTNTLSIVDGGGTDTLDLSGFGNNTKIDIRISSSSDTKPAFSNVAGLIGNLSIGVGTVIENVVGGAGNEMIYGNSVGNNIHGGSGNDWIEAGGGVDSIYGDAGNDTLYPGAIGISSGGEIFDGGTGTDLLEFSGFANHYLVNLGTGAFDLVAGGYLASVANIENVNAGNGNDSLVGNSSANILRGGGGNDTLWGGSGVDTLYGGAGNDSIVSDGDSGRYYGEDGNDTMLSGLGGETMDGGTGIDLIDHRAFNGAYVFDMGTGLTNYGNESYTNFENVLMGNGNDSVTGNSAANMIDGGGGNDTLIGGSGVDTIYGGAGNDSIVSDGDSGLYYGEDGNDTMLSGLGGETMDGGTGIDLIDHRAWNGTYVFDMGTGLTNYGNESYTNFENVLMGNGNDSVTGSSAANMIDGGGGNDTLWGGLGDDSIDGGAGDDELQYNAGLYTEGADTLNGGTGNDTLMSDVTWTTGVLFDLVAGQASFNGSFTGQVLMNIENVSVGGNAAVIGDGGANRIEGLAASGNNVFDGGAGNDTLLGGGGNDVLIDDGWGNQLDGGDGNDRFQMSSTGNATLIGGIGDDTVDFRTDGTNFVGTAPRTIDLDQGYSFNGGAFLGTWSGLENILSFANLAVTLIGNSANNLLQASSQNDTLIGESGNDTLMGLGGDDALFGGAGNDSLNGSVGNDTLDGGTGDDAMQGGNGDDTYVVDSLGDTVTEYGPGGTDTIRTDLASFSLAAIPNVENLTGTAAGNQVLGGNILDNEISAGAGDDALFGGFGNDTLNGGFGSDLLNGGSGNDSMRGGNGDDTYIVDSLGDTVTEYGPGGTDTIRTDLASFSLAAIANVENLFGLSGAGQVLGGNILDNAITGANGNDSLYGGAGNDTLMGKGGNDLMNGGSGGDTFIFTAGFGHDRIAGFHAGPTGDADVISITTGLIADFADLLAHTVDVGPNAVITVNPANTITLLGVHEADLDVSDFVFV